MILDVVGLPIGPLIASAGIVGVAVGFGAQSLVKDFLSGHLHHPRGPVRRRRPDRHRRGRSARSRRSASGSPGCATATAWSGTSATARSCGSATTARAGRRAIVDMPVAYTEDIPRVQRDHRRDRGRRWPRRTAGPRRSSSRRSWPASSRSPATSVTIRVVVKCRAERALRLSQRELRERIKEAFDREGVRVPPPVFPGSPGPL